MQFSMIFIKKKSSELGNIHQIIFLWYYHHYVGIWKIYDKKQLLCGSSLNLVCFREDVYAFHLQSFKYKYYIVDY